MHGFDGTITAGRKGIAYDWRSLLEAPAGVATQPAPSAAWAPGEDRSPQPADASVMVLA